MKDFPSCFGENGVQVADFSSFSPSNVSRVPQNTVTCVYQCILRGKSCCITVTWSKNLMGQSLSVGVDDKMTNHSVFKVDIKPWLFSAKKKGSKILQANDSCKIDVYWDLCSAKFGSGPEPLEGFYVGIVFGKQMVLLLGDMRKEALKKTGAAPSPCFAVFVSKREHIFGKRLFSTKAKFYDISHDLVIECDTSGGGANEPILAIRLDNKLMVQVKRLRWKFRGNQTIFVNGLAVEVFWDVHNWLFGQTSIGSGVFMFKTKTREEKLFPLCDDDPHKLHWSSSHQRFRDSQLQSPGFSLILYAWKNE
ncbi:hypothetical protein ACJIZ3_015956 [Penstemon smallii]|uniref:DUF868 domain-containing protein n=1 Tax=Penstemon smallii TaxID=265156 RepID=A0ABD3RP62_9LAMI